MRFFASSLLAAFLAFLGPVSASEGVNYQVTKTVPLGTPDRWDYVVFDPVLDRVYVSHGEVVTVVDGDNGAITGTITVGGTTHGIASVHDLGKGYTDDGKSGVALAFDLKTLKVLNRIKVEEDADGIVYDPRSGHVLVITGDSGKVSVIDPKTDTVVATIDGGGGLEFGVLDGKGKFYVDGEKNNDIVRMDLATNKVDAHWPLTGCNTPHGLAIDRAHMRLFASCANKTMVVVNAETGVVIATLPIGQGTDFAEFDSRLGLAFSSNRDGTLSVIKEVNPDKFVGLQPVATAYGAKTMALNPKTGRIYLVASDVADNDAAKTERERHAVKAGTVKLLFLDPSR
jgi:YVTN family beta-propeller protein